MFGRKPETWVQMYPTVDEEEAVRQWGPDYIPVHVMAEVLGRVTTRFVGRGEGTITQCWRRIR